MARFLVGFLPVSGLLPGYLNIHSFLYYYFDKLYEYLAETE